MQPPSGDRTSAMPAEHVPARPPGLCARRQVSPRRWPAWRWRCCASACAPHRASARGAPDSLAPLVKKVLPAVVNIAVTETVSGGDMLSELPPELRDTPLGREFRRKFGNRHEQVAGAGSGFIIDPSGIIVTNNHVVDHADKIVVSLTDGRQLPATVLGRDELTDVAVIKVQRQRIAARRHLGRFAQRRGRRLDPGRRQSVRPGRLGVRRHHLRRGPRPGVGSVRQFPAAGRADQPGQLRRAGVQHGRPGDRRQLGHRLAHRRLGRHRLRHPQRVGEPHRRPASRQGIDRARLAGRLGGRPRRRRDDRQPGPQRPGRAEPASRRATSSVPSTATASTARAA